MSARACPPNHEEEVHLPESVEATIERICLERKQPPLKKYVRKMLAKIGEQASIEILTLILINNRPIASLSGYISFLVKKYYPTVAATVLGDYHSPATHCFSPPNRSEVGDTFETIEKDNFKAQEKMSPNVKTQSSFGETTGTGGASQQLTILNNLVFRKLFLFLSYIGMNKLEDVITLADAEEIYGMKDLPMKVFETKMWDAYGHRFCAESDRCEHLAWDSGKTHLYYCYVCKDGSYYYKGPYLNSTRTHIQRSLGDDNILAVKFPEDAQSVTDNIMKEGIFVGLRRYRYFVFKDERKKSKKNNMEKDKTTYSAVKCYFVHIDGGDKKNILSGKTIGEARCLFMHLHTLSTIEKYMARFSLILSKTMKLGINLSSRMIKIINDIPFRDEKGSVIRDEDGKPLLHTDGTGYISEDLAMKCPNFFSTMKYIKDNSFEIVDLEQTPGIKRETDVRIDPPLLMQCRLFYDGYAVKGTLLINKKLEEGTIQIRPSMIKVEKDQTLSTTECFNSLEIVNISRRPSKNFFSKYLIALLSYGGVPQDFFLNLLMNALEDTRNVYYSRCAAMRVASNHDGLDFAIVAQSMIACGIPLSEPYLQHCLLNLERGEKTRLKEGKIPVTESFYLMGTADPTGILKNDEVCVILDNGPISGPVLVYRNPGMHFGDVHIMKAVYVEELTDYIGNAKYGIFFSTKGSRSAAYEMATGDFDGDMYWVSRNLEILKYFKAHEPWHRVYSVPHSEKKNPQEFSEMDLESELFQLFLEARTPSFSMATAADSWLAYMDRLLTLGVDCVAEKDLLKKKMIQLIDIYYDALDAPKSGKKVPVPNELRAELYPHHMERGPDSSYKSISVLGQIYDRVLEFKTEAVQEQGVWKLTCLDVPVSKIYLSMWKSRYEDYRKEMWKALKSGDESVNDSANEVIKKYKQLLYEAPDMEESQKDSGVIYDEALAIYHVTYDYAMTHGVEKCGFAWRVAGSALCSLCAWLLAGPKEKPVIILPSVLRDLLK